MVKQSAILGTLLVLAPLFVLQSSPVDSANILGLFSTFSPSHLIVHMSMMKTLADRGHNVTVVTALKPKLAPHENITVIMAPLKEESVALINQFMANASKEKKSMSEALYNMVLGSTQMINSQFEFLTHPNVKAIYEKPQMKFDLMFLGFMFNDFQLGVAAKLKIPTIMSWVGVPFSFVDDEVGNVYDPSYVPSVSINREKGVKTLNFGLRLRNFGGWVMFQGISLFLDVHMNEYYNLAFGQDPNFPTYHEMRRKISLLFYNYHSHSEGPVRPTVPQSIEIGGVQIKEQPDPLPKDLNEFLGNATQGAIFFSLGTNVKASYFKPHIVKAIFNVLSRQPMRVIWKWDDLNNKPGEASNIYFHNWLPQDDILAHPNVKLFITHAGKGGIAEAQYHGVPMLALPVFGDQPSNAEIMVSSGFGLSLDLLSLTEESFEQGIQKVLSNPEYLQNVQKFSALYRDRPLTARQSVIYWTEYVMRHNGAYHLQSPMLHMSFVERNNLDVYAFILLSLGSSLAVLVFLIRFAFWQLKCLIRSRQDKVKKC